MRLLTRISLLNALASAFIVCASGQKATSHAGALFALTNRAADNEVIAFSRGADGTLTQTGRYSTGGNGIGVDFDTQGGLQLSENHRFLYACNPGSDNITVFAVNGFNLRFVQKIYAGDQPLSITIKGKLLYVLDGSVAGNQITGFKIAENGRLTPLSDSTRMLSSPIAVPGQILFDPDGRVIVVTHKVGSNLDVFRIRSDGRPSDPIQYPSFGPRPFAAAFRGDGRLLVAESGLPVMNNSALSTYRVDFATGAVTVITGSAKNGQTDSCWVLITKDQQFAYTANFISGTISTFRLNDNGTAVLLNGAGAATGQKSQPTDLSLSADGRYLYNLLRGEGTVAGFRVEADGQLTSLGTFGVGSGLPVADGASGMASY